MIHYSLEDPEYLEFLVTHYILGDQVCLESHCILVVQQDLVAPVSRYFLGDQEGLEIHCNLVVQ